MARPLYKNKKGEKLYPVCSFEENQHKLYNMHDRIINAIYDKPDDETLYEKRDRIEHVLAVSNTVIDGLIYATYEDSKLIKDLIATYNATHA